MFNPLKKVFINTIDTLDKFMATMAEFDDPEDDCVFYPNGNSNSHNKPSKFGKFSSDEDSDVDNQIINQNKKKNFKNRINVWKLSNHVNIYPHLCIDKKLDYDGMMEIILDLKDKLFPTLEIFDDNDYCYEVNGKWNICVGIPFNMELYTYMIRYDNKIEKVYLCPFENIQYTELGHFLLSEEDCEKLYLTIEEFFIKNHSAYKIKYFRENI